MRNRVGDISFSSQVQLIDCLCCSPLIDLLDCQRLVVAIFRLYHGKQLCVYAQSLFVLRLLQSC